MEERTRSVKKVPQGTSDYQAAWIADDLDGGESDSEGEEEMMGVACDYDDSEVDDESIVRFLVKIHSLQILFSIKSSQIAIILILLFLGTCTCMSVFLSIKFNCY